MTGLQYRYDYFSARIPTLVQLLASLRDQPAVKLLEIGSFEGLSASWFLSQILTGPQSSLTCIDPWEAYADLLPDEAAVMQNEAEAHFDHNTAWARSVSGAQLLKHKGRSETILPLLLPASFDMIYIDGSHQARDVLSDMVFSWRLLKPGGLMICDDYEYDRFDDPILAPKIAIDAFLKCYQPLYELLEKKWLVALRKIDKARSELRS